MNPNVDVEFMKSVLQAMIFVSDSAVTTRQMLTRLNQIHKKQQQQEVPPQNPENLEAQADDVAAIPEQNTDDAITLDDVKSWIAEIREIYASPQHGFELVSVAQGYQFRTKLDVALALQPDKKTLPGRLSASAMETLAIVAYEQPVARAKVDDVRGVDSGGVLKTLLEKEFVRIVGRADEPGQPLLYGTTQKFLEVFNLKNLKDMPSLAEIRDLYLKTENEPEEGTAQYFDPEDVIEQRMSLLSEEETELMQELDESLKLVKNVEEGIELFHDNKTTPPTVETTDVKDSTLH